MPVIPYDNQQFPAWCELESYEIIKLDAGADKSIPRRGTVEKLIVLSGGGTLVSPEQRALQRGDVIDLPSSPDMTDHFALRDAAPETTVVHLTGHWGSETGGSGVFTGGRSDTPKDKGDPVWYPKETNFDRHYHDCDEYWIFVEGRGVAMSEGKLYDIGPGDCLATGMGHHHDLPQVTEPVRAVYVETTLAGQKRRGHLWEHTHGPAEPKADRV